MQNVAKIFDIREYNPETDKAFVMATTLNGVYYGCHEKFDKRLFMNTYKLVLQRILESLNVVIMVACSNEEPNLIFGYSIMSSDYQTIHWVFVKKIYRQVGIGRALVPAFATSYTHVTEIASKLVLKFESKPVYNPFQLSLL
jgi:hypothetical protein